MCRQYDKIGNLANVKNRYNKYCKLEKHEDKTTFRQENMAVKNIQLKRQKNKITRRKTRYNK